MPCPLPKEHPAERFWALGFCLPYLCALEQLLSVFSAHNLNIGTEIINLWLNVCNSFLPLIFPLSFVAARRERTSQVF